MAHRRPPKAVIIVVVVALVAAGIGAAWWFTRDSDTDADQALSGTIEATTYDVASVIAGRVASIKVSEGDTVAEGDVIATLDSKALSLQVSQASQGVNAAKAAVQQARDDGTSADIAAAQAKQKQAEAAVSLAKVQLGYATITAPADGVIETLTVNAGQTAGAGRTLATIVDTTDLFVRAYVAEPDLGDVRLDQSATITSDSDTNHTGTVTYISDTAEFTPNNVQTKDQRTKLVFAVRLTVSDDTDTLKPGMPVDVTFD